MKLSAILLCASVTLVVFPGGHGRPIGDPKLIRALEEEAGEEDPTSNSTLSATKNPLNILLVNDDGFETDLIQNLFVALESAGHGVVMSAPYGAQTGSSGKVEMLEPFTVTTSDSPQGTKLAGSPALGPTGIHAQQHYIDGPVSSATLYGIDVLAKQYFGGVPDLVISGPNEGNNMGTNNLSSGTVMGGAAFAMIREIPAVAVSAALDEENPLLVAEIVLRLVNTLVATSDGEMSIPPGYGLNVNVGLTSPNTTVADYHFKETQTGQASGLAPVFYANISQCAWATVLGLGNVHAPAMCFHAPYDENSGVPTDTNEGSEGNVLAKAPHTVTVSVIQPSLQAPEAVEEKVFQNLGALFMGSSTATQEQVTSTTEEDDAVTSSAASGTNIWWGVLLAALLLAFFADDSTNWSN